MYRDMKGPLLVVFRLLPACTLRQHFMSGFSTRLAHDMVTIYAVPRPIIARGGSRG